MLADLAVVGAHAGPVDAVAIAQRRFGDPRHNGDFGPQMFARWFERPTRSVNRAHGVLDADVLFDAALDILFGAPHGRQDQCNITANEMRTVEFGRDLDREARLAHRLDGDAGVRRGLHEVAAEPDEDLGFAVAEGANRIDGVEAVFARRIEAELLLECVQEMLGRLLPDAHRPIALNIGMTAHRAQARTTLADIALGEGNIDDFLDRRDRVVMLGQPHRPAIDRGLRLSDHLGGFGDLGAAQTRRRLDEAPVDLAQVLGPHVETGRMGVDEVMVESIPSDEERTNGLEEGEVAIDPDRQMQVGEIGAPADNTARLLRIAEVDEAGLAQRIDRDDLGAAEFGGLEGRKHPWVIRARVLTGYNYQFGVINIAETDACLADTDRLGESDARRLVAHVGAIGQIVGAESPDEQLIEEGSLVGGAPGGVEDSLVGAREPVEVRRDERVRVVPGDGFVMTAAGPLDEWLGDAALLAKPVFVMTVEGGDAVVGQEPRRYPLVGGFLCSGFGAVFAELGCVTVLGVRIGPGATHAVETVGLIELEKGLGRTPQTHLGDAALEGYPHPGDAGSGLFGSDDADLFFARFAGAGLHRRAKWGTDWPISVGTSSASRTTPVGTRRTTCELRDQRSIALSRSCTLSRPVLSVVVMTSHCSDAGTSNSTAASASATR